MGFSLSHVSLALSLMALALAGVGIYRNTYDAMINKGLQNITPDFEVLKSALTLNNERLSQQSRDACILEAVKDVVESAIDVETRMAASLLRLHFHDCFVDGCEGGILLEDIPGSFQGEQNSPPNLNSARGYEVIAEAKQRVKDQCPNRPVSCADILAIAARDSVVKLGGQPYTVELGRSDGITANFTGSLNQLPAPFDNLTVQIQKFADKNLNVREMIALAGAHTLGFARCSTVCTSRNVNPAARLSCNCSLPQVDSNLEPLDITPGVFDRAYFEDLTRNQGKLFSDQVLTGSRTTNAIVVTYSNDDVTFFNDFSAAMIKMGRLPPAPGARLEIRDVCSRVNPTSVASI